MNFDKIGLQVPEILLPNKDVDLYKWSVVACDQYTSQPDYWEQAKTTTENQPSTLNVIFPEVFLEDSDGDERIKNINNNMQQYLDDEILVPMSQKGFVLVDRKTSQAPSRKGLVVAIDLEQYDFNKGSQTLIRATEGTIVDRLPPRIKVRQDAAIELPHIMVLIDDPQRTVIEPLFEQNPTALYDFELMMNSGHLKGYAIDTPELIQQVADALENLASPEVFAKKYNAEGKDVLLYAMGDGNHSLATAKAIWEKIKQDVTDTQSVMDNPARYALVELVNIHDEGLQFEPIHRVIFNVNPEQLLKDMQAHFSGNCSICRCDNEAEMKQRAQVANIENIHIVPFNDISGYGYIQIENPVFTLELATIESFLNDYLDNNGGKVDFIHGDDVVNELGVKEGNMGFFFPPISKHSLFKTIIFDGALPRKTFSMGEADEKRFYLEARKIK
ncbi:DUF1015 domain-containing protein [sulfur-oxidizing endosymbiont of Gigantopelta aegis]|uniref:DUF1015 domain-containing protein n=1 Tax=sulfur-oxidizing endosymbiont of Gigantopelta aegis TaxID=2794934 RepID=UPI001FE7E766|nr:DUF1015 domain-containing protein [sulfur-oxidizing endosymbiont of Gigantopelta aegis]